MQKQKQTIHTTTTTTTTTTTPQLQYRAHTRSHPPTHLLQNNYSNSNNSSSTSSNNFSNNSSKNSSNSCSDGIAWVPYASKGCKASKSSKTSKNSSNTSNASNSSNNLINSCFSKQKNDFADKQVKSVSKNYLKLGCPQHDLMPCIMQTELFSNCKEMQQLSSHCLCNGYSLRCPANLRQKFVLNDLKKIQNIKKNENNDLNNNGMIELERWNLLTLGLSDEDLTKAKTGSLEIKIKLKENDDNSSPQLKNIGFGFDIMRCYGEAFKKRFRPGFYVYDGKSQRQVPRRLKSVKSDNSVKCVKNGKNGKNVKKRMKRVKSELNGIEMDLEEIMGLDDFVVSSVGNVENVGNVGQKLKLEDMNEKNNNEQNEKKRSGRGKKRKINNNNSNNSIGSNGEPVGQDGSRPFRWGTKENQIGTWVCFIYVFFYYVFVFILSLFELIF